MKDDNVNTSDMRCNMLRCISNLSIIHVIDEFEVFKFDKVRLFDIFMPCAKNCKNAIYRCDTCTKEHANQFGEQNKKNVFICLSCMKRKSCHPIDHQFKRLSLKKDIKAENLKCGCHCNV